MQSKIQPPKGHVHFLKQYQAFDQFIRNGVWGTCTDCPRDNKGNAYPEFCENANRGDHQLTIKELVELYKSYCD